MWQATATAGYFLREDELSKVTIGRVGALLSISQSCTTWARQARHPWRWKPSWTESPDHKATLVQGSSWMSQVCGQAKKPICRSGSGLVRVTRIRYRSLSDEKKQFLEWHEAMKEKIFWPSRTDLSPIRLETFERLEGTGYGNDHLPNCDNDDDENVWVDCAMRSDTGLCMFMFL